MFSNFSPSNFGMDWLMFGMEMEHFLGIIFSYSTKRRAQWRHAICSHIWSMSLSMTQSFQFIIIIAAYVHLGCTCNTIAITYAQYQIIIYFIHINIKTKESPSARQIYNNNVWNWVNIKLAPKLELNEAKKERQREGGGAEETAACLTNHKSRNKKYKSKSW